VAHGGCNDLVDGDPGPDHHPSLVIKSKDEHEAGVHDDLKQVMGAGDKVEPGSLWYGVLVRVTDFQLSKDLVSIQLIFPRNEEYQGQDQIVDPGRHTKVGGDGEGTGEAGARYKSRSLTEISRTSTEVVSKANNVVGDVHGGVARLVDEDAFIESSEYLES